MSTPPVGVSLHLILVNWPGLVCPLGEFVEPVEYISKDIFSVIMSDRESESEREADTEETPTLLGVSSSGVGVPVSWISWRFTTPFTQRIQELFDRPDTTYLAVHETSAKGVEHWHVLTIGHDDYNRVKIHVNRRENFKGMKWWSKKNSGTFEKALAYTMKTVDNLGNSRILKSDDWPDVPYTKWVFTSQPTIAHSDEPKPKKARLEERDWQLTYSNLVFQAVKFHRERGLSTSATLKQVVKQMIKETKWRPCNQMYKCGVLPAYELDFKFRIGQLPEPDMAWYRPRIMEG